jgi:NAD-dependent SIR2 family protein deacetylase
MHGLVKLRTCTCCGEAKPTSQYTHNPRKGTYTPTCKDCGVWLHLFRQVFGKTRDWEKNRINQRQRSYFRYTRIKSQAANDLFAAWGIRRVA